MPFPISYVSYPVPYNYGIYSQLYGNYINLLDRYYTPSSVTIITTDQKEEIESALKKLKDMEDSLKSMLSTSEKKKVESDLAEAKKILKDVSQGAKITIKDSDGIPAILLKHSNLIDKTLEYNIESTKINKMLKDLSDAVLSKDKEHRELVGMKSY